MPTILRIGSLRFVIWPNDHSPAHVHVFSGDGEAKIGIGATRSHPWLIENRRMSRRDLAMALAKVFEHRELLLSKWKEIHGGLDSE